MKKGATKQRGRANPTKSETQPSWASKPPHRAHFSEGRTLNLSFERVVEMYVAGPKAYNFFDCLGCLDWFTHTMIVIN